MMTAITNPTESPIPPMTAIKLMVVRRTASFTLWMSFVMRTAPIRPGSRTGAAANNASAPLVSLWRISALGVGLVGSSAFCISGRSGVL